MACIVHIGHGKTGSSFIQSNLAINSSFLEKAGYKYPDHPSIKNAKKGLVSSGNGELLLKSDHEIPSSAIYSNELLFTELANDELISSVISKVKSELIVVLYTRDLFEHSSSVWGQYIKRGKGVLDYNTFTKKHYGNHLKFIKYWILASEKFKFKLKVYNYSRHKSNLWKHFVLNALSVDFMSVPDACGFNKVNRSLTIAECELQRLLNQHIKVSTSSFISDRLVNNLPEIKSEPPYLEEETFYSVSERLSPAVSDINQYLENSEKIIIQPLELINSGSVKDGSDVFSFSSEQLEEIAKSLCNKLDAHHASSLKIGAHNASSLKSDDANYLRDIALKIKLGKRLKPRDAFSLMFLAKRARLNGSLLKK